MMRKVKSGFLIIAVFCVYGCMMIPRGGHSAMTEEAFFKPVRPITLGPVTTFEQVCANCHGPQGSFYGPTFAKLDDAKLTEFVKEMMIGPASLKPTETDLEAMTAYNRALAAGQPFICIVSVRKTDSNAVEIRGECSPDAKLTPPVELKNNGAWRMHLATPIVVRLEAVRGGVTSRLVYPPEQWTDTRK